MRDTETLTQLSTTQARAASHHQRFQVLYFLAVILALYLGFMCVMLGTTIDGFPVMPVGLAFAAIAGAALGSFLRGALLVPKAQNAIYGLLSGDPEMASVIEGRAGGILIRAGKPAAGRLLLGVVADDGRLHVLGSVALIPGASVTSAESYATFEPAATEDAWPVTRSPLS
ncbi:hypothetical protein GCM10025867_46430 (plasmid) [Frondihabitans sucicola]|uniref:Uncharacterized protein n=1 Tax=Frondihabitans sucicola TaxID=1268041 RepID=A0ABM8GVA9_9MICO|nr:hypothetical protein [Frondihabitans sucicola]BDZ52402.1 hypothetical protein GCM10025867_46430 [Frondihabitans sucicola]